MKMKKCADCRYSGECLTKSSEVPECDCTDYRSDEKTSQKSKKATSICWKCSRLDCSWILKSEPVAGWEAVPTNVGHMTTRGFVSLPSYRVEYCPGFIKGDEK